MAEMEGEMAGERRAANVASGQSLTVSVLQRVTENLRDHFTLGRKLGQGQFGTTYLCIEKATGKEYTCKSIVKRKLLSQEDVDNVRREIHIMHHLSGHPNIVTIKGAYEDASFVHLVMELCAGGGLLDRIIQRGHYSEANAAHLTRVIVGVVEACHSLGIMHRDLKPETFLLANSNEDAPLKAADFGLSVFFHPDEVFTDVVGSPSFVAPEVLRKHYGPEADVWSAGVILYILLSGVPPFWAETEQGIFEQVLQGDLDFMSDPWPSISENAKDLIRKMLNPNPQGRLKAHQVLSHPWIQEGVASDKRIDPAVQFRLKQFSAMNKVKKMALRVIAESLSEEEIAGLKEVFKTMDTDDSGTITYEELRTGLKHVGSNLMESVIKELMEAADVVRDGAIDYVEFIAATMNMSKIEREENLFAAFSYFDKDNSGYITVDELQQACQEHNLGEVRIEDMIREVDQDNDGRIDYNEFVAMLRKGNGGIGQHTMRNSLRTSLGDVLIAEEEGEAERKRQASERKEGRKRVMVGKRKAEGIALLISVYGGDDDDAASQASADEDEDEDAETQDAGIVRENPTTHTPSPTVPNNSVEGSTLQPSETDNIEDKPTGLVEGDEVPVSEGMELDTLNDFLPPIPTEKYSGDLQTKFLRYLALKKTGKSLNEQLRNTKGYRNPDFLQSAVRHYDIDPIGSFFKKEIFDPHGYEQSDYHDSIAAQEQERRQGQRVEFVRSSIQGAVAGAKPTVPIVHKITSVSTSEISIKTEGRSSKKSKWDKVEIDGGRTSQAISNAADAIAAANAHAALLTASANAGAGYASFAQQRRKEAEGKLRVSEKVSLSSSSKLERKTDRS